MRRRRHAVVLALLFVSAGCLGVGLAPLDGDTERRATVTGVVDGDTIDVRFADGSTDTVRLLGVDAPETDGRNRPGEFEGVPETEAGRWCLGEAAGNATRFVERHLENGTVRVVVDPAADRRGDYGRLLAYVVLPNGTDLNYRLVETGRSERYYEAESRAQSARRGLWACRDPDAVRQASTSPLRVVAVNADAPGNDHENLDGEYVVFENAGDDSLYLTGWTVSDGAGRTYRFPDGFALAPGETVTLYTGAGEDGPDALYWGAEDAIWNNDGDEVVVRKASGEVALRYRY